MRIRVIGVGTPFGDDAAGLAVAERLARGALPEDVEVMRCERPAAELLDHLTGAPAVVLVDALRGALAPGSVHRVPARELAGGAALSSHGLGVAETLALAEALGRAPLRCCVVGIAAGEDPGAAPGAGLSPAVRAGVEAAVREVRIAIAELRGAGTDAGTLRAEVPARA